MKAEREHASSATMEAPNFGIVREIRSEEFISEVKNHEKKIDDFVLV